MNAEAPLKRFLPTARVFSGPEAFHAFIVTLDGDVYGVGENSFGQLGYCKPSRSAQPLKVEWFSENDKILRQAACGQHHSHFLLTNGELWSCGSNNRGELGVNDTLVHNDVVQVDIGKEMVLVEIAVSSRATYCLTSDGDVVILNNLLLQVEDDPNSTFSTFPASLAFPKGVRIVRITTGYYHGCALDNEGIVWNWNEESGIWKNVVVFKAEELPYTAKSGAEQVICGGFHTTVIFSDGSLYSYGFNTLGQIGDKIFTKRDKPSLIEYFRDHKVKKMSIGGFHTVAVMETGDIVVFGWNEYAQLGLGDTCSVYEPTRLPYSSIGGFEVVDAICGHASTLFITTDRMCHGVGFGAFLGCEENVSLPKALVENVDVYDDDDGIENSLLKYIAEEQAEREIASRTTDMTLFIRNNSVTRPIRLNKALVVARCSNLLNDGDILAEHVDEGIIHGIVNLLYADRSKNRRMSSQIRSLFGMRPMSVRYCMAQLYSRKEDEGDVSIASSEGFRFKAHKFVLVARTTYFAKLFRGGWREAAANNVRLEMPLDDFFDVWLKFLYTGVHDELDPASDDRFKEYSDYFGTKFT